MKPLGYAVLALILAATSRRAIRAWAADMNALIDHLFHQ